MPTPMMPVLMSDISQLTKPLDIIKRVLQWYFSVPKNINDTFAEQEISFRYDDARSGHDIGAIKELVKSNLSSVLSRYFPTATALNIDVSTNSVDDVRYNIVVDIVVIIDGQSYSISQDYEIDSDGNLVFKLKG